MDFKWPIAVALGCFCVLAAPCRATADDEANPYSIISERNVFHLNPPPPPPNPDDDKPKEDLPVIKITGIVDLGGKTRALFVSQPKNGKDAPTYFNLAEGEREGILEVVKIDSADQKVDVINSGKPSTLTMKDDSLAKSEGTPPPAAPGPGQPPVNRPGGPPPFPGAPAGMPGRHIPQPGFPSANGATPGSPYPFPAQLYGFVMLALVRRRDESLEQRMRRIRLALKFRMKLARHKKRM
jgi:hypothetical protein